MTEFPLHRFTLNGYPVQIQAPPLQSLLDVLRERCGLRGTKCGCGEGECGACTVLVDDQAVMSCLVPVVQIQGADVRTIESLAHETGFGELQQGFLESGGCQCGFCTPGVLMMATSYLEAGGSSDRLAICEALAGNLCRCTGYGGMIESVQRSVRSE
jgi:aerobic-type carbon monoxide dehydrogenase small subunit (CoxS/CutS family)